MNKLAQLRVKKKLTVRQLAELAGVSTTTINRLELGYIKSHALTIGKIAEALDVDILELAELIEESPKESGLALAR